MAGESATSLGLGGWDPRRVPVSYDDPVALEGLERALEAALAFRGDAIGDVDAVLAEHPDFCMAWLFKAGWLTQTMETRIYGAMVEARDRAAALANRPSAQINDRERGHLDAVSAWIDGDFFGAVQKWEAVLVRHPLDLFALALVHYTDVLLGDVTGQRDVVARVFTLWDESLPGYEFVLGFYSFGLEENRDFALAEEMGRRALALRPDNPYAVHAVCHVMEMRGRQAGGIRFMADHVDRWGTSNFANHLWWHTALLHLDLEHFGRVLEIYDRHLGSAGAVEEKYQELDAAALLWRLTLLGEDVGNRWRHLADKWEPSAGDTLYAFNDVHAMMTFVADDRRDAQRTLLTANERYIENASDANAAMSREIGQPFCLAIQDFKARRYDDCVDRLLPVRYRTHRLGGSFAQRDVIGWTLLEAALRAGRYDLALGLANERAALKPASVLNWRAVARAFRGLGSRAKADQMTARAQSLVGA